MTYRKKELFSNVPKSRYFFNFHNYISLRAEKHKSITPETKALIPKL